MNGYRPSGGNPYSNNLFATQRSILSSQNDNSEMHSLIETMRAKWMTSNDANRLNYLDRLIVLSDKAFQIFRSQHPPSSAFDAQFHQALNALLSPILEILSYIMSANIELSVKIKLVLSTSLAWVIKHGQGNFCKKNYKSICTTFKNVLLNGQSNNRQLAVCYLILHFFFSNLSYLQHRNSA